MSSNRTAAPELKQAVSKGCIFAKISRVSFLCGSFFAASTCFSLFHSILLEGTRQKRKKGKRKKEKKKKKKKEKKKRKEKKEKKENKKRKKKKEKKEKKEKKKEKKKRKKKKKKKKKSDFPELLLTAKPKI